MTTTTEPQPQPADTATDTAAEQAAPAKAGKPKRERKGGLSLRAVDAAIARLQRQYLKDEAAAVAALAQLRRGAGRPALQAPTAWGISGLEYLAEIQDEAEAAGEPYRGPRQVAYEQEAVHLALTLYALHQQSVRDEEMDVWNARFGSAVRTLAGGGWPKPSGAQGDEPAGGTAAEAKSSSGDASAISETIRKRFVRVGTASSLDSLAVRLRELVLLLRAERLPLDYGRLADQLARWQNPALRPDVRRDWGRDFLRPLRRADLRRQEPDGDGAAPVPAPRGGDGGEPPAGAAQS
ncbi:type I-E CRISPR-associated protein Cse2/CasB [Streptomyces sp. SM14]|uniref:type I-E CRISPR-associated protein Cse2/CasB n=1 Tax=Streptomyces sp. SM14 TaxID=1736045 RepID=UPI000CD54B7C|nr:type I-E CRISPR-associated protein Cse2/CasB [Streptomyces sp. SM14]